MRALKGWSYLTVAASLMTAGCQSAYVVKGPEVATNTVKISNCKADPDTVRIAKGATLTWTIDPPDGHSYSIHFPKRKPISSANAPTGQGQTVTGDDLCNWSIGIFCKYGYDLTQDPNLPGQTTCPDPGVHVGSGGP